MKDRRDTSASDRGIDSGTKSRTVLDLNRIPDEVLAELRASKSMLAATVLLEEHAHGDPSITRYTLDFVRSVVFGDENPREWRRGGVLVPRWGFVDMMINPPDQLLAPIFASAQATTYRLAPNRLAWEERSDLVGAPAIHRPDLDYTWPGMPNTARLSRESETEPIGDLDIAVRRWIAARLAMVLDEKAALFTVTSPSEMYAIAEIDPARVTDSAARAAAGLLLERPRLQADPTAVPGFCGPDQLYRRPRAG